MNLRHAGTVMSQNTNSAIQVYRVESQYPRSDLEFVIYIPISEAVRWLNRTSAEDSNGETSKIEDLPPGKKSTRQEGSPDQFPDIRRIRMARKETNRHREESPDESPDKNTAYQGDNTDDQSKKSSIIQRSKSSIKFRLDSLKAEELKAARKSKKSMSTTGPKSQSATNHADPLKKSSIKQRHTQSEDLGLSDNRRSRQGEKSLDPLIRSSGNQGDHPDGQSKKSNAKKPSDLSDDMVFDVKRIKHSKKTMPF